MPYAKHVTIGALGSGDTVKTITMKDLIPRVMAYTDAPQPLQYKLDLATPTNSNPDNVLAWVVCVNAADGSTSNYSVAITFEVTYWADMTVPKAKYAS